MSEAACEPFWMVHGNGPTAVRHAMKEAAEREAIRLAEAHPGQEQRRFIELWAFCLVECARRPCEGSWDGVEQMTHEDALALIKSIDNIWGLLFSIQVLFITTIIIMIRGFK